MSSTDASQQQSLCLSCGCPDHGTLACAPTQAWFWTLEWQAAERAVDADLAVGWHDTFDTMEEFIAGLPNQGEK